ncbi:MAG: transporter [Negativicoccus succinicivorans]|uniref:transporter n=1 Tax=Negativicoccus succinicivorans TaxID=620903 RepID=UPI00290FE61F|nr:transporter [Negativicoccus succinicivorans]MDU5915410.1 transporter [Negativicoccus succinicivorans]
MRKLAILTACACLVAGAAMAAPVTYIPEGGTNVGYGYNGAQDGSHAVYVEHGIADKVVIGAEYRDLVNQGNEFDVYGKYRLNDNVYVTLGNRNYDVAGNKLYAGVEGMTYLTDKFDGYASVKVSSEEKEYKVGALYDLNPNFDLDVNYTYQDRDEDMNRKGVGVGLNYRF